MGLMFRIMMEHIVSCLPLLRLLLLNSKKVWDIDSGYGISTLDQESSFFYRIFIRAILL
uniref:Uncharacterized protein n=1 Tax=Arundo donax TaxID=35708 RepID=A0A0A9GXF6_ARUDO